MPIGETSKVKDDYMCYECYYLECGECKNLITPYKLKKYKLVCCIEMPIQDCEPVFEELILEQYHKPTKEDIDRFFDKTFQKYFKSYTEWEEIT